MVDRLSEEDRVRLALAHERINHIATKEQLLAAEKREATQQLLQLSDAMSAKYKLGDEDTVDVRDGSIKRGSPVVQFLKRSE